MAQITMHNRVLEKWGRLPTKVQKKLTSLFRKFEEDSKQASIHLEKIQPLAKDPKVRSARVGDDYRAIVIAPEKGDVFMVVHVDHHDEAYRWCANKLFEASTSTGGLQVIDLDFVEDSAKRVEDQNQSEQHNTYCLTNLSDEELFSAGVPSQLLPSVRAITSDKEFDAVAQYLPEEAKQVLYGYVCGMELDEAIEEMLGDLPENKPEDKDDFSKLVSAPNLDMVVIDDIDQLIAAQSSEITKWRTFLHPYQKALVNWNTPGPIKVTGAAGTGKTVVLIHRAVRLAKELSTGQKLLITTFTTNLALTIKGLIQDFSPDVANKIEVVNLHKLARDICLQGNNKIAFAENDQLESLWQQVFSQLEWQGLFSQKFIKEEYYKVIEGKDVRSLEQYLLVSRTGCDRLVKKQRQLIWPYFELFSTKLVQSNLSTYERSLIQAREVLLNNDFDKYRHVLVDELQDFSLSALKLISCLCDIGGENLNTLYLTGDGHQRLYSNLPVSLKSAGIDILGRAKRLKINYRNSEQIREFSQSLIKGINVDDLDGGYSETTGDIAVMKGDKPFIVDCPDYCCVANTVVDYINKLISEYGLSNHEICITSKKQVILNKLDSENIKMFELESNKTDPGKIIPGVRVSTKKRVKGLEYKAVVVVLNSSITETKSVLEDYVACTRAIKYLLAIRLTND